MMVSLGVNEKYQTIHKFWDENKTKQEKSKFKNFSHITSLKWLINRFCRKEFSI